MQSKHSKKRFGKLKKNYKRYNKIIIKIIKLSCNQHMATNQVISTCKKGFFETFFCFTKRQILIFPKFANRWEKAKKILLIALSRKRVINLHPSSIF